MISYADDLVALCHSQEQAEQVKATAGGVAGAQGPGLQRGQDDGSSTSARVSISWGSMSAATRRQAADQAEQGGHQAGRERLAAEMRALRGGNAKAVLATLNPVTGAGQPTTGAWCHAGYSTSLDDYMWKLTYKWAS